MNGAITTCVICMLWTHGVGCSLWQKVPQYSDYISTLPTMEIEVRSNVKCAVTCNNTAQCVAFIFAKNEPLKCQILNTAAAAMGTSNQQFSQDAVYYSQDTSCGLSDDTGYSLVVSTGGNFAYKIHKTGTMRNVDAQAICSSEGGTLFSLTSVEKLSKMRSIIMTCLDYTSYDFRVDGTNVNGEIDGFTMINGDVMPHTLWNPGFPNDGYPNVRCIWLWGHIDWQLDDVPCVYSIKAFICEKTI